MAVISRLTTWSDGQTLTASALNGEFNNILNDYNGGVTNANISGSAGIAESKLTFSGSGHGHTGGTDGKLISINRGFGFFISGTPSVANDLGWNPRADKAVTAVRLTAYARTAPTGSTLTARVFNVTQGVTVGTVDITAGNNSSSAVTSFTTASIAQDDVLRVDITAIGSTIAGSDISVVLGCTQP